MFDHRLAALLGRTVAEMRASLSQREYMDWALYWQAEPWGPWRDNLHAALVCREVQRPYLKPGASPKMEHFMYQQPEERKVKNFGRALSLLKAVSRPVKRGGTK